LVSEHQESREVNESDSRLNAIFADSFGALAFS